jgi:hypothetical protein
VSTDPAQLSLPLALGAPARGAAALVTRDDGTPLDPRTNEEWDDWVAAGATRAWCRGDPLWDWLDLLVLPFSLSLLPISLGSSWSRFCETRLALGLLVIAGYSLDWRWTGFQGNTFWDWLHLLLVPFLLPASVTWLSARTRAPRADAVRST